jgi:CheY-like chemotaxis protein
MPRPRILLVGGNPMMAAMVTEHLQYGGLYDVESAAFCDQALTMLTLRGFALVLILSLHVPWTIWPQSYSSEWRADLMNAILFLKHMRTLTSPPPVILLSGSPLAAVKDEALASGAFAFIPKPAPSPNLTDSLSSRLRAEKGNRRLTDRGIAISHRSHEVKDAHVASGDSGSIVAVITLSS